MLSYKKKIALDRTFGTVAVVFMKYLTQLMGVVMNRDHTIPSKPRAVAVAKIVGMGSIVYTGILCRALKKKFPGTKLIYITSAECAGLLKRMNYVDEVLLINDKGLIPMVMSTLSLITRLWHERPKLYFDMEVYSSWAAILATLTTARNRYGFYRKNAEFKRGMHTHTVFFNTRRHISEIYSQMALAVGAIPDTSLDGIVKLSDDDRKACDLILKEAGVINTDLIVINPNVSDLLIERRWPVEKWVAYLDRVTVLSPRSAFLMTGTAGDIPYVSSIYDRLPDALKKKVLNMAGLFGLGPFLALLERCMFIVTNDSGPVHFAAALGKPTVSIWGPGDPEHYAPLEGRHEVVYRPVYCSPCLYHSDFTPCHGQNVCVSEIPVDAVLEATLKILRNTMPPGEHT